MGSGATDQVGDSGGLMMKMVMQWAAFLLGLMSLSCKEEFPVYAPPANLLKAELQLVAPDTVDFFFEDVTNEYYLTSILALNVNVTNIHDDLLEGRARIEGRISAQSFSQVPRTLVVPLTRGDLRTPSTFQGNIALAPQRTAVFSVLWIPIATDTSLAFEGTPFVDTPSGRVFEPISFIAQADVQLFDRVQPVRTPPIEFRLVFRVSTE